MAKTMTTTKISNTKTITKNIITANKDHVKDESKNDKTLTLKMSKNSTSTTTATRYNIYPYFDTSGFNYLPSKKLTYSFRR